MVVVMVVLLLLQSAVVSAHDVAQLPAAPRDNPLAWRGLHRISARHRTGSLTFEPNKQFGMYLSRHAAGCSVHLLPGAIRDDTYDKTRRFFHSRVKASNKQSSNQIVYLSINQSISQSVKFAIFMRVCRFAQVGSKFDEDNPQHSIL